MRGHIPVQFHLVLWAVVFVGAVGAKRLGLHPLVGAAGSFGALLLALLALGILSDMMSLRSRRASERERLLGWLPEGGLNGLASIMALVVESGVGATEPARKVEGRLHVRGARRTGPALILALLSAAACRPTMLAPVDSSSTGTLRQVDARPSGRASRDSRQPRTAMKSYFTTWGSPARSSRVPVSLRHFESLVRVTSIDGPPRAVVVNEAGDHVALDLGHRFEVRSATGAVGPQGAKTAGVALVLDASGVFVDDRDVLLAGGAPRRAMRTVGSDLDRVWALRLGISDAVLVLQRGPVNFMRHAVLSNGAVAEVSDRSSSSIQLQVGRFSGDAPASFSKDRGAYFDVDGCGALGADGRAGLALADGRFLVFDVDRAGVGPVMQPVATSRLSFVALDISAVDGGFALLSGAPGGTGVHLLDTRGVEVWQATVPFAVDAPPIDAGGGRVYVAGSSLSALEAGKVLWTQPSSTARVFATSLADGSVLVALGPELRAVDRDGAVVQVLQAPEGDAFVAPPAVAGDGSVWLATAKALYVAR